MDIPTVRLVFDRKHQASKTHRGLVQIEVRQGGKRKFIGTGVKLLADQWHEGFRVVNHMEALALNARLSALMSLIEKSITAKYEAGEAFDLSMLDGLLAARNTGDNFVDWMSERLEARRDIRPSTKRTHRRMIDVVEEFGRLTHFGDLTKANIVALDDWLHERYDKQVTVWGYHKRLRSYINDAIERELLDANPYQGVKISRGYNGQVRYLTLDELRLIEQAALVGDKLAKARDLFVVQCYTGLAYADLAAFDWGKVEERDGQHMLRDTRRKTDEQYYIVLLPPVMAVLERYGYKLPVISNQKYNDYLKCVAVMAGINKPISSHWGRHTFAVMALSMGVRMQNVSKMLGHASMRVTEIVYAKVLPEDVIKDFEMLGERLK